MAEPTQRPAFLSEWNFNATTTAPPASGQARLNQSQQKNATRLWVSRYTANGIDATVPLESVKAGDPIKLHDLNDVTKFHDFTVSAAPIKQTDYWEYPLTWVASGANSLSVGKIVIDLPSTSVSVNVKVSPALQADTNSHTEISGQLISFDYAYPFQGKNVTSPGMTLRQWYASQAMVGFISASNVPASNLVGRIAIYAFQVADSMLAHEQREQAGFTVPVVGGDRNAPAPNPAQTAQAGQQAAVPTEPTGPAIKTVWPRRIIS